MAKAGLTDADNILELVDDQTNQAQQPPNTQVNTGAQGQIGMPTTNMLPTEINMPTEDLTKNQANINELR